MPMKPFLITLCLLSTLLCRAQSDCSCQKELEWVAAYYQRNLPGYTDNVNPQTQPEFEELKKELSQQAAQTDGKVKCFKILTRFVEYFRDNHSRIMMSFPNVDESKAEEVKQFKASDLFQQRERVNLSPEQLEQHPLEDMLGIYQTVDEAYTIALIPRETQAGKAKEYVGVITASKTELWEPGQVKLELIAKENGNFEAFVYMRNHSLVYYPDFVIKNGRMGSGWFKTNLPEKVNHAVNHDFNLAYRKLDEQTSYLRIPTFSGRWSARLDSFYKAVAKDVRSTPHLIIDVRNNGGGSDDNVQPLLDYIYTNPLQGDVVEVYATADNIAKWEEWYEDAKKDRKNFGKSDLAWFKNEIRKMKAAPLGSFIPRSNGGYKTWKVKKEQPQKVAIICNRECASSCETLLFWAKDSKNTMLVGENSGGYVGYGEVGSLKTPCFDYTLTCTMTRYRDQRKYEVIGISPDHYLDSESDWIDQTLQLLKSE